MILGTKVGTEGVEVVEMLFAILSSFFFSLHLKLSMLDKLTINSLYKVFQSKVHQIEQ